MAGTLGDETSENGDAIDADASAGGEANVSRLHGEIVVDLDVADVDWIEGLHRPIVESSFDGHGVLHGSVEVDTESSHRRKHDDVRENDRVVAGGRIRAVVTDEEGGGDRHLGRFRVAEGVQLDVSLMKLGRAGDTEREAVERFGDGG